MYSGTALHVGFEEPVPLLLVKQSNVFEKFNSWSLCMPFNAESVLAKLHDVLQCHMIR